MDSLSKPGTTNNIIRDGSRIVIQDPNDGKYGVGLALSTSRSIGDAIGKKEGLIATPEIDIVDINDYYKQSSSSSPEEEKQRRKEDSEWFAIVASDGLLDVLSPQIIVEYIGRVLYKDTRYNNKNSKTKMTPLEACERIIREASAIWAKAPIEGSVYRDDITLGVSKINF